MLVRTALFWFGASIAHIEDYIPTPVFLLFPDGRVLAVLDCGLSVFAEGAEFVISKRVAQIAGSDTST